MFILWTLPPKTFPTSPFPLFAPYIDLPGDHTSLALLANCSHSPVHTWHWEVREARDLGVISSTPSFLLGYLGARETPRTLAYATS